MSLARKSVRSLALYALLALPLAQARDVTILAPNLPPMVHPGGTGHEADIIRETLAACGHVVSFTVQPFVRHWTQFREGRHDAVTTVPPSMDLGGFHSVTYIRYQNGISVLRGSSLPLRTLADLQGKSVIAFKGAKDILPGLKEAIPSFSRYDENTEQLIHSNLLFAKRADAVIADGLIFAEHNRQLRTSASAGKKLPFDPSQGVVFSAVFPATPYTMVFRTAALRDDFNRCFAKLQGAGRIDAILRAAVAPYRETVGTQYLGY